MLVWKVEYVKQEKNFLAKLGGSPWVIRLVAAFQDKDHIYMVRCAPTFRQ